MLQTAALAIAFASASLKCTLPSAGLPFFAAVTPPYNAAVESGPLSIQVRVRASGLAEPWRLVSDMTLISSAGESVKSSAPEIQTDDSGGTATFFFASVESGRTYHMQLHWHEPPIRGCPPVKWTSMLGQFSTL